MERYFLTKKSVIHCLKETKISSLSPHSSSCLLLFWLSMTRKFELFWFIVSWCWQACHRKLLAPQSCVCLRVHQAFCWCISFIKVSFVCVLRLIIFFHKSAVKEETSTRMRTARQTNKCIIGEKSCLGLLLDPEKIGRVMKIGSWLMRIRFRTFDVCFPSVNEYNVD